MFLFERHWTRIWRRVVATEKILYTLIDILRYFVCRPLVILQKNSQCYVLNVHQLRSLCGLFNFFIRASLKRASECEYRTPINLLYTNWHSMIFFFADPLALFGKIFQNIMFSMRSTSTLGGLFNVFIRASMKRASDAQNVKTDI